MSGLFRLTFFRIGSSSLPYFEAKVRGGRIFRILIDTGSNRNYIQPKLVENPIPNKHIFEATTVTGKIKITHHKLAHLFKLDTPIKFFLLPTLKSFDVILGNDSLKELRAVIDTNRKIMNIKDSIRIKIKRKQMQAINQIVPRTEHLNKDQKAQIKRIIDQYYELFTLPDERLTYTTNVVAEIRTSDDNPVYSKFYQYPMSLKDEINKQIKELLDNEIIRPSRSPYNAPVWIVPRNWTHLDQKSLEW